VSDKVPEFPDSNRSGNSPPKQRKDRQQLNTGLLTFIRFSSSVLNFCQCLFFLMVCGSGFLYNNLMTKGKAKKNLQHNRQRVNQDFTKLILRLFAVD
jgi:hypothetical protein